MNLSKVLEPFSPPETNFVERLRYWALAQPESTAFRFLVKPAGEDGEDEYVTVQYGELDEKARAIAAKLVSLGYAGQRALLMYPTGLDFITAFFGCHYAGIVPIPAYPPRRNRNMGRINAISKDAQAAVCLVDQTVLDQSKKSKWDPDSSIHQIPWVTTDIIPLEIASDWVKPQVDPSFLALIQYTSGATGSPKGVMLTHRNLLENCRMIAESFGMSRKVSGCTWLPLYHDMGLIGGILHPMYFGIETTIMSPISFLTKPIRWLRAISRFKGTDSGGPSFAYALCTTKITEEQCEGLDLSSWKVAFNGAEPVRADVMDAFTEKFEPYGFDPISHYPCYGMAETTLIVTGSDPLNKPIIKTFDKNALVQHRVEEVPESNPNAKKLVGCGKVISGEEVIIVNPETRRKLGDAEVGEIWINSPSGGQGYWNKPEISAEVFRARISPDNGREYIRSGDLGFMDKGELFVAGRLKDMIIVRGVNRYPQDLEATVEQCDPRTQSGGAAAFSIDRWDREHLVIVCEVQRNAKHKSWDEVINEIRSSVADEHDLPPDAIVLVRAHSIPKTSSGKVQRHACRQQFIDNTLMTFARWVSWEESYVPEPGEASMVERNGQPATQEELGELSVDVVEAVKYFVREVGREQAKNLTLDTNIVHLGLDSLARTDIASYLCTVFGGTLPDEVLQDVETVREVAEAIQAHIGKSPVIKDYQRLSQSEIRTRVKGPIPESYYQLDKMPEFVRLHRLRRLIDSTGLRNPFFGVHEGRIGDTTKIDGRELISFASYNYLGLSGHPDVSQSAKNAIDEFGTSVSASRIVSGEKTIHRDLEKELSDFLDVEDVITFPGGHATNESVIGHLVGSGDLIIHDSLAHNSIIQGAELSGARRRPFKHNDYEHLNCVLEEVRHSYRRVLIAIEGLYSMDGDYPDLPKFIEIKNRYKAWLFVDEAHSIGTMGKTGRGLAEVFDVNREDVECWMGTLSKAFGSCGGFIGGTHQLIEYLRYTTPGYVFAAGMPPANVGAALGALRVLKNAPERVKRLQDNSRLFLKVAKQAGLNTGRSGGGTPIIPIITSSSIRALRLSEALFNNGINAQPILHPAVADDEARVRIFMTAEHSEEQIRTSVAIIDREWKQIVSEHGLKSTSAVGS